MKKYLRALACISGLIVLMIPSLNGQQGGRHVPRPGTTGHGVQRISEPYLLPAAVTFTDNFDGPNDTTSLKSRGYLPYYRGSGPPGISPTWFTGWSFAPYFSAYNGPDTSYVASEYQSITGSNELDNWLVLPALNVDSGDTLSFYCRSPQGSLFTDTVEVMYSASGDSVPEGLSWTQLGVFQGDTSGVWVRKTFLAPAAGATARFAIRHHVIDAGPLGNYSDYIGIDQLDVIPWNTVGIQEPPSGLEVRVYPNPVHGQLHVSWRAEAAGTAALEIYSALGKLVLARNIKSSGSLVSTHLDVSQWEAGLYFVSVKSARANFFSKILVQ